MIFEGLGDCLVATERSRSGASIAKVKFDVRSDYPRKKPVQSIDFLVIGPWRRRPPPSPMGSPLRDPQSIDSSRSSRSSLKESTIDRVDRALGDPRQSVEGVRG